MAALRIVAIEAKQVMLVASTAAKRPISVTVGHQAARDRRIVIAAS
jgi:hypothetical protein